MKGNKHRDRIFAFTSWLIVFALLYSTVMLWVMPPSGAGPIAQLLGVLGSQIFYSVLYLGEAGFLAFSKLKKRSLMRKNTLLVTYLTGFFTFLLTLGILGWTPALIDNLVISIAAAGCWLYWTFKTEYLTVAEFDEVCREDQGS